MPLLLAGLYVLLTVFQVILIVRIVFDVVTSFAPHWRPRGAALVVASATYAVTDRPLRAIREKLPPLNLGGVQLDLAFLVLFFAVVILKMIVTALG
jgi:YggT family protein